MAKTVFTTLMMPMQVNRREVEGYVQMFKETLAIQEPSYYFDEDQYTDLQKFVHHKTSEWLDP